MSESYAKPCAGRPGSEPSNSLRKAESPRSAPETHLEAPAAQASSCLRADVCRQRGAAVTYRSVFAPISPPSPKAVCWSAKYGSVTRYVFLAPASELIAAGFAPIYTVSMLGFEASTLAVLLMSFVLIWRHQSNIVNLMAGKEGRIGEKKSPGS